MKETLETPGAKKMERVGGKRVQKRTMATKEKQAEGGKKIIAGSFGLFSVLGPRQTDSSRSLVY